MARLRRVLIANRGEIAVRVIRACRDLGIEPVAVYAPSEADAPHVRLADAAVPLPADEPAAGYLNPGLLVDLARRAAADAIHPGYGFLAENPVFAAACDAAGITFVGPSASVLARCGDKAAARAAAVAAGAPVLVGTQPVEPSEAATHARKIGFPLLIKAVGGGGGKGIHLVHDRGGFDRAFQLARGEAETAFGDGRVYLERWIRAPRHVEVQIVADAAGRVVHLGERACSVQRRHQKLIEEAPAPAIDAGLRARLADAAVRVARELGYRNAGTVEFLVDGDECFFIEVNARIQVEHTVTEATTGVDLVALQLRLAAGEPLPFEQDAVAARGAAIECRISAEDPHRQFFPSLGVIDGAIEPAGPGVRVDSGVWVGQRVSRHFDPLLAKIITYAPTRDEAIARMRRALAECAISGVDTTMPFHRWALEQPDFISGGYDVRFADAWGAGPQITDGDATAALVAAAWFARGTTALTLPADGAPSRWNAAGGADRRRAPRVR
jgi:acetyl-CoA carboxylase biotin carboxylase subunit